ncbi:unnamed protein product [Pieris macdunnoughi]|uniref:Uncharacterized protein n=1 Tax=Pieris macdunnoughi TaxID=345717 RepID=A0A821THP4_9NEOP|nr:unnamed protein product [Pieris macdunnoughi]
MESPTAAWLYHIWLLIRRSIRHRTIPACNHQQFYTLGVELAIAGNPTHIIALYCPPGGEIYTGDAAHALQPRPAGDHRGRLEHKTNRLAR